MTKPAERVRSEEEIARYKRTLLIPSTFTCLMIYSLKDRLQNRLGLGSDYTEETDRVNEKSLTPVVRTKTNHGVAAGCGFPVMVSETKPD